MTVTKPFLGGAPLCVGAVLVMGVALAGSASAADHVRLAQAGSTGGTLGKTDQSLSGGQRKPGPAMEPKKTKGAAPEARQSGCARIAGSWAWSNGLGVVIGANGTASSTSGDKATWICTGGMYLFKWQMFGTETRVTLSADGKRLSGTGPIGPESGMRQ